MLYLVPERRDQKNILVRSVTLLREGDFPLQTVSVHAHGYRPCDGHRTHPQGSVFSMGDRLSPSVARVPGEHGHEHPITSETGGCGGRIPSTARFRGLGRTQGDV